MELVASTLHTTSEFGVSSITTADEHTSAASSRLNWRPSRFKWIRPFRRKTKTGFCACAIVYFVYLLMLRVLRTESNICLFLAQQPPVGQGRLIHEASRSHTTTHHSR